MPDGSRNDCGARFKVLADVQGRHLKLADAEEFDWEPSFDDALIAAVQGRGSKAGSVAWDRRPRFAELGSLPASLASKGDGV
jgi:hypothetical protein